MKLSDFSTLTFDCYGMLIDWESGIVEGLKPLTSRLSTALSRDDILEAHARHESSRQVWTPTKRYSALLSIVYKRLAEECIEYGRSVKQWPAFPDSVAALQYLKKYFKLVILSNVDNESFAARNEKLQVGFDAIYTAEDVGSYKPADGNFVYMTDKLHGIGIETMMFCILLKVCFTIMSRGNDTGWHPVGDIVVLTRKGLARPWILVKCRWCTFALILWKN